MMNILLFIHIVIALLLIIVILLQRTGADTFSSLAGGSMGIVSGRSAANFLTKTTIVLATIFFINSIVLANLSSTKPPNINISAPLETAAPSQDETNVPIAK